MTNTVLASQLRDSEEVLAVVRRSPLAHIWGFALSLGCIIAAFFFLYPLLRLGRWGLLLFAIVLLVGIFLLSRTIMLYRMNVLVLTSERIIDIDQQGFFSRVVSECLYENIQEMSLHIRGVLGTMFRLGSLFIHTEGSRADLKVSGIIDPQKVQEVIARIQQKKTNQAESEKLTAEEMVALLQKIRRNVDISAFTKKHLRKDTHNED